MKPNRIPKRTINLIELIELALLNWLWLAVFGAAGLVCGYGWTLISEPVYEAAAVIQVDHNPEQALADNIWQLGMRREYFLEEQTRLLEGMVFSDEVAAAAVENLSIQGGYLSLDAADFFLNASMPHPVQGNWRLVFRGPDAELAAQKANAWAAAYISTVEQKTELARELRAQRVHTSYLSAQLASMEHGCAQLPGMLERLEEQQLALANSDPAADASTLTLWWLDEVAAGAGLYGVEPAFQLETNADVVLRMQDMHHMLSDAESTCPEEISTMQSLREESLEQESELAKASAGISPYLEISLKREAAAPAGPVVQPVRAVLIGTLLGLAAGFFWLLVQISRQHESGAQ